MIEVTVLHAPLDGPLDAAREAWLFERLPYARRLELEGREAAARAASLHALELLRRGVEHLLGTALEMSALRYPAGGKPALAGGPHFSISHSGTRVAVALSEHGEVGIDIEDLADVADADRLLRWTAVEATLKATGSGLRRARDVRLAPDLASARCGVEEYRLQRLMLAPGCVAHLATVGEARVQLLPWSASYDAQGDQ
jgi:phosphopantetheinyl transferase